MFRSRNVSYPRRGSAAAAPKQHRLAWARCSAALAAALLLLGAAAPAASAAPAVQFVQSTAELNPNTTFELRFPEAMVSSDMVGKPADPNPVQVSPAVAGRFVWLSSRSGVFSPDEPLTLSTTYRLTLRHGLKDLHGESVPGDFEATVQTPPFALKGWHAPNYFSSKDVPATPRIGLLFNAKVDAAAAASFISFVDASGKTIPAEVKQGDPATRTADSFPAYRSGDHSLLTWAARFRERGAPSLTGSGAAYQARDNLLWIKPVQPLSAGDGWRVVLEEGLPASEPGLSLLAKSETTLGTVQPFEVRRFTALNNGHGGRRIVVTFTKPLAKEVTAATISRWLKVKPAPAKMVATVSGSMVEFTGNFALDTDYLVETTPGLRAAEPFILEKVQSETLSFEAIPASLALEEFSAHELAGGSRHFHMRVVNTPRLRVSAKLLPPESLPAALTAYEEKYLNPPHPRDDEWHQKLPPDQVAGKTIFSREIVGAKQTDTEREIKLSWDEILGAGKTGAVLVTVEQEGKAKERRPGAQAIVQVTDLGLVWKTSPEQTFVHVFSMANGAPVAGARLRLVSSDGAAIQGEAVSDASGSAMLPSSLKAHWLLAQSGADFHLAPLEDGQGRLSLYRFRIPHQEFDDAPEGQREAHQVFIFTERGVYKPGETVHLKALVRDAQSGAARIPKGVKARLKVLDAREREIFNRVLTVSDFGSIDADIALPQGGLGTYGATLSFGPEAHEEVAANYSFEVQEYTPNAFEIAIDAPKHVVGAVPMEINVSGKYYMGKALSQAQLSWTVEAGDQAFAPEGFDNFAFGDAIDDYRINNLLDRASSFSDQGKLDLKADGKAVIATTVPINPKAPQPRHVQVLCEITDLNQQTVSNSAELTVDSSEFYLGLGKLPEVVQKGDALELGLLAVRTDGTPAPVPAAARMRLTRIDWQNNRVETDEDATENESAPIFKQVEEREVMTQAAENREHRWMAVGAPAIKITAGEPGLYLLEVSAKDAAGHDVLTSTSYYVTGENVTEWNYRNEYQIELVPDKLAYLSGETARVLVKTPIAGEALVTVERDRVLRSYVTQLSGNAPSIEVALRSEDAPNVFVSVMMLRGAKDSPRKFKEPDYRVGFCQLKVTRPESKLTVYVAPERPKYQPGEMVNLAVEVRDIAGRPTPNAEVTLYAVDEGVLSLTGYTTPDPLTFFNTPLPLSVVTSLTIPSLLKEDPEQKSYENKGYMIGGGGDLGEAFRKNFVTCAFWNANLRTDSQGRATANCQAPDSLTRYRLIAVVQTREDAFGAGESAFEVSKPVMLDPALPRFANIGDRLSIRGVLHNLTDQAGEVEVRLTLDDTARAEHLTQQVQIPAHGSLAVDFPVEFIKAGQAKWQWVARFNGEDGKTAYRDAVQSTLKVGYPVTLLREVELSRTEDREADLLAKANPALLEGEGVVRVSIGNSRIIQLRESLGEVLHYPYGCVEQTTSSTLPWIVLRDFRGALPELDKSDAEIRNAVNHGLDRLLTMQTDKGGLSYWPGGANPHFWGSAYGGLGMALAKRAGFEVPAEALDSVCKYLSGVLRGSTESASRWELADRCLALYTLAVAGRPEAAYHEKIYKRRDVLTDESRALLAMAIHESKGSAEMVSELLEPREVRPPDEDAFWCRPRQDSVRLLAWTQVHPDNQAVDKLVTDLFGERAAGHWGTTQGNAWALFALSEYLKKSETHTESIEGQLAFGARKESFALPKEIAAHHVELPFAAGGENQKLALSNPSERRIYSELVIEAHPRGLQQPRQDQGFSIERSYARVADDNSLSELKDPVVGDRVLVTLRITVPRRARYVAVNDPLPAIFEAVNPVFKSQETASGRIVGQLWEGDFKELREDRALFFADFLSAGDYTIRYLARVRAAGTATAPAAKIEEMYHPEHFGMSETMQLTSLQLK